MRLFTLSLLLILGAVSLTGCGGGNDDPATMTVDASSEKALDKSVQRIADQLYGEKKEEFLIAVETIQGNAGMDLVSDFMQGDIPGNTIEASMQMQGNLREKLDGKTADEIIEISKEVSDAEKAFDIYNSMTEGTFDPLNQ